MIDGKRLVVKAKTHGERETRIRARLNDHLNKPTTDPSITSVFIDDWLKHHIAPNRAYRTHRSYAQMLASHVTPEIGDMRVVDVSTRHLQAVLNKMTKANLSPTTCRYMRMILRLLFKQARAEGLVVTNPATALTVPKMREVTKRVLSEAEFKKLVEYRGTRFSPLFAFMLATGLRVSEALAVTDADLDGKAVTVRRQLLWRSNGVFEFSELKSPAARRRVPLSALSIDAVERARAIRASDMSAAEEGYTPHGLLFATESGRPTTQSNVHRALRSALAALKIPPASVHDLRRTFITRLARVESRPQIVKAIAGHTSLSTTMQYYVTSHHDDEADAVARALTGIMM